MGVRQDLWIRITQRKFSLGLRESFLMYEAPKKNRLLLGVLSSLSYEVCKAGLDGPSAGWGCC